MGRHRYGHRHSSSTSCRLGKLATVRRCSCGNADHNRGEVVAMARVAQWAAAMRSGLIWLLVLPIRGYQRWISAYTGPSCKYHPTCSAYAIHALRRHGPIKGLLLGSARLARCNPWSEGGVNPVPAKGRWRADIRPDGSNDAPLTDLRELVTALNPPQSSSTTSA